MNFLINDSVFSSRERRLIQWTWVSLMHAVEHIEPRLGDFVRHSLEHEVTQAGDDHLLICQLGLMTTLHSAHLVKRHSLLHMGRSHRDMVALGWMYRADFLESGLLYEMQAASATLSETINRQVA